MSLLSRNKVYADCWKIAENWANGEIATIFHLIFGATTLAAQQLLLQ